MNLEIFKRNIQLSKLGISELEGDEKKVYEYLRTNLSELNIYLSEGNPDYLYFGKDISKTVFCYDKISGHLYVNYNDVSLFKNNIFANTIKSDEFISWWVKVSLDLSPKYIQHIHFPFRPNVAVHRFEIIPRLI